MTRITDIRPVYMMVNAAELYRMGLKWGLSMQQTCLFVFFFFG